MVSAATPDSPHRWGAWCLDCGAEDLREIALADACPACDIDGPPCPEHVNPPCPEPGSGWHDPYRRCHFRLPGRPGPVRLRARVTRMFDEGVDPLAIAIAEQDDIRRVLVGGDSTLDWVHEALRRGPRAMERWRRP